jgi:hypothetical protein
MEFGLAGADSGLIWRGRPHFGVVTSVAACWWRDELRGIPPIPQKKAEWMGHGAFSVEPRSDMEHPRLNLEPISQWRRPELLKALADSAIP